MKPNMTVVVCFTITLLAGVFLWFVPRWLFNWLLVGMVVSALALVWMGVVALYKWSTRLDLIYPDENGNYPIKMLWRVVVSWRGVGIQTEPVNLNLTGAHANYQHWATWQITNNRGGSQPRELAGLIAAPQNDVPLIQARGQSLLIDAIAEEF